MPADYHIHTPYCGHARGRTLEYVESALAAGFDEIAFTDHLGRYYLSKSQRKRYWDWGMAPDMVARYHNEILNLREIYAGRITVRVGLEIDYIEGAEELLEPLLGNHEFDFLLGSLHCLPSFSWRHLSRITGVEPDAIYREYFRCMVCAAESNLFNSLAHTDFVWRYIPWPTPATAEIFDLIDSVVATAAAHGVCLEINANAFNWSLLHGPDNNDPFEHLLSCIAKRKACITLGSDAHAPESVGAAFADIIPALLSHGITSQTRFDTQRKFPTPLTAL